MSDTTKTNDTEPKTEDQVQQQEPTDNNPEPQPSDEPQQSAISKAIDELGIGPEDPAKDDAKGNDAEQTGTKPDGSADDQGNPEPKEPQKDESDKKDEPEKEPTEEELLVGVNSERGRERLGKLLAEGRQTRETLQAMQRTISSSGLDRESFANLLEISRLVSSNDPADIEKGLKAFEDVRTRMYQALGREAPGVDVISQYPDLVEKVKAMGMSREDALTVIQARQAKEAEKQRYAAQRAQQAELGRIQQFGNQVQQVFAARSKEADFDAKIEVLKKHFSRPGVVQDFVARNAPENWSQALMFMYDNIPLPAQHSAPGPITQNRARTAGIRVTPIQGGSPASIEERIREMGL